MRWLWFLLVSVWAVAVRAEQPAILILGDSLSAAYGMPVEQGWVSLFAARLRAQGYPHRIVNVSISGETTRGGLDRLQPALDAYDPALVIVELGANDGLQGLSLEEMAANLRHIVEQSRASGAQTLLARMRLPPNYGPSYIEKFVSVFERIGTDTGVPLTPFMLEGVAGDPRFIQDDGLHPNSAAQPRILENLWPAIEPLLRESPVAQQASP